MESFIVVTGGDTCGPRCTLGIVCCNWAPRAHVSFDTFFVSGVGARMHAGQDVPWALSVGIPANMYAGQDVPWGLSVGLPANISALETVFINEVWARMLLPPAPPRLPPKLNLVGSLLKTQHIHQNQHIDQRSILALSDIPITGLGSSKPMQQSGLEGQGRCDTRKARARADYCRKACYMVVRYARLRPLPDPKEDRVAHIRHSLRPRRPPCILHISYGQ